MEKPKGKILHTDKEPANSVPTDVNVDAKTFLDKASKQPPVNVGPNDDSNTPAKETKNNAWVWVLVAVIVIAIVITIVSYVKAKKELENNG